MTCKALFLSVALAAAVPASSALAAPPAPDTREFDLACAGLLGVAFQGAKASKAPAEPQFALMNAYGMYIGRLSMRPEPGDIKEVEKVAGALTTEEQKVVINACMAKAKETLGTHLLKTPEAAAKKK
jgi:hypothetical protein